MAAVAVAGEVPHSGPLAEAQVEVLTPHTGDAASQPHWFRPEAFLSPDFDATAFIADLRRYVPLETLSSELENHLSTLKLKLVEVINEDYADFVSLSTQLVNVDGAVARMQRPLGDLKEQLGDVASAVGAELEAIQGGLQRRADIAAARAMLELMQDTAHVMSKVEKLLDEVEAADGGGAAGSGGSGEADLDARVRLYERVASEVSRLQFYAARGADLPFIATLQPRMAAAASALQGRLAEGLAAALAARSTSAVGHALHAYSSVGDAAGAQAVVRRSLAAPLVAAALQGGQGGGTRSSPDALPKVLAAVADGVQRDMGELLAAVMAPASGLHAFDFLGGSLLPEVDEAVSKALPGAFSPGVPAAFLANYTAALNFLERLEQEHIRTRRQLAALRAAPAVSGFLRRWNLSVYFSLRFQEIAAGLDTVVSEAGLEEAQSEQQPENGPALQLQASAVLVTSLRRCLAADVFLRPLADKFTRLALQLVARYAGWLSSGVRQPTDGGADGVPLHEGEAQCVLLPIQAAGWGKSATAEQLTLAAADADALAAWLSGAYAQQLTAALSFLPSQVHDSAAEAWRSSAAGVSAASTPLIAAATEGLAERCAAALKHVRGISTTYRMVARPAPTRPSHYVPAILAPLSAFLDHQAAQALAEAQRTALCRDCIIVVCSRFQTVAGDLLETVRKTESSLKRLKKHRGAGDAPAEGAASDTDKMTTQLFLDVQEFGRQVFKFEMDPSELPAYRELWAAVAPTGQATVDAALLLG